MCLPVQLGFRASGLLELEMTVISVLHTTSGALSYVEHAISMAQEGSMTYPKP